MFFQERLILRYGAEDQYWVVCSIPYVWRQGMKEICRG